MSLQRTVGPVPARLSGITKWVARAACILAILGLIYLLRAPLLTGVAQLWIVNEEIGKADAIVLLGGSLQTRAFEAARLYREGYAPRILAADVDWQPTDLLEVNIPETDVMKQVLLTQGVPDEAIVMIGNRVSSTYEEAVAVNNWVKRHGAHSLIVPTEIFHTRRVNTFFTKVLKDTGTDVRVEALIPPEYTAHNWWQHEEGVIDFQNEIIKFAYYVIKY